MRKFAFVAALIACAVTLISLAPAQDATSRIQPDMSKKVLPTMRFQMSPAVERTPEQMDRFAATYAAPSEEKEEPAPRPTMDSALYAQLKRAAALAPHMAKPSGTGAPTPLAPVLKFTGATECDGPGGCWAPPDVAGSIGKANFVAVSNDVIEIFSRGGVSQKVTSLNAFFGYSTQPMFDPRVQYDEEYQRWIVTADAFQESSTVQYLGIAVSQTSSPTGKWWIYFVNTNNFTGTGSFYDYPMLGMTQDAVLFTSNVFGTNSFLGSYLFSVAKSRIYNGFGFGVPVFGGLYATLEPPHQLLTDQNGYAWLAAAPGGSSTIQMYTEAFPANPNDTALYGPYAVGSVAPYGIPPAAAQPTSCAPAGANLDTLDNRFQNQGTQNGDFYYQVHTTSDFGVPTPRYYIISGLLSFAPTVAVQNDFYGAGTTTNDWNPSIASDPAGHFAVNWSSTDPTNGVRASMYFADNKFGNPVNSTGSNLFQSASCYTGVGTSRWGDYSQTTLDPGPGAQANTNLKIFWIDNETIPSANFWSTEVAKVPY
jgi:hypothetical protein